LSGESAKFAGTVEERWSPHTASSKWSSRGISAGIQDNNPKLTALTHPSYQSYGDEPLFTAVSGQAHELVTPKAEHLHHTQLRPVCLHGGESLHKDHLVAVRQQILALDRRTPILLASQNFRTGVCRDSTIGMGLRDEITDFRDASY
jgi:hypothetical protein